MIVWSLRYDAREALGVVRITRACLFGTLGLHPDFKRRIPCVFRSRKRPETTGWPWNLALPGTRSPWCRSSRRRPTASIPAATGKRSAIWRVGGVPRPGPLRSGTPIDPRTNKRAVLRHAPCSGSIRCGGADGARDRLCGALFETGVHDLGVLSVTRDKRTRYLLAELPARSSFIHSSLLLFLS